MEDLESNLYLKRLLMAFENKVLHSILFMNLLFSDLVLCLLHQQFSIQYEFLPYHLKLLKHDWVISLNLFGKFVFEQLDRNQSLLTVKVFRFQWYLKSFFHLPFDGRVAYTLFQILTDSGSSLFGKVNFDLPCIQFLTIQPLVLFLFEIIFL